MKSDTLIGIIGSVLLVGIIFGVFVYEYNNVEELSENELKMQAFSRGEYGHLEAEGDIDQDGILNFEDEDIDGDNINNDVDEVNAVIISFDDTFDPQAGGDIGSYQAVAFFGIGLIEVDVTVEPTVPLGIIPSVDPLPAAEEYLATLTIDGVKFADEGLVYAVPGVEGNIVLTVSSTTGTLGGSLSGTITLNY